MLGMPLTLLMKKTLNVLEIWTLVSARVILSHAPSLVYYSMVGTGELNLKWQIDASLLLDSETQYTLSMKLTLMS